MALRMQGFIVFSQMILRVMNISSIGLDLQILHQSDYILKRASAATGISSHTHKHPQISDYINL